MEGDLRNMEIRRWRRLYNKRVELRIMVEVDKIYIVLITVEEEKLLWKIRAISYKNQ